MKHLVDFYEDKIWLLLDSFKFYTPAFHFFLISGIILLSITRFYVLFSDPFGVGFELILFDYMNFGFVGG